jgi:septal ring-binding cell division protein DamX
MMAIHLSSPTRRNVASGLLVLLFSAPLLNAQAWTLTLNAASRRVFLQVGNGSLNANNALVNQVSVTVSGNQLGNGAAQPMSSNSTQANSPLDNFLVCTPPAQVYVGGSYQRNNAADGPATALLQVASPANLSSAAGDVIPFTEISWTTSTLGADATPNVIAAGQFSGGTQTLANIPANRYVENCHTFSYANTARRAAGTYDGSVTYTLSTP